MLPGLSQLRELYFICIPPHKKIQIVLTHARLHSITNSPQIIEMPSNGINMTLPSGLLSLALILVSLHNSNRSQRIRSSKDFSLWRWKKCKRRVKILNGLRARTIFLFWLGMNVRTLALTWSPSDGRRTKADMHWKSDQEISKTRKLIVISGFIHDVAHFLEEHPGGQGYIRSRCGRDATTAFFGGWAFSSFTVPAEWSLIPMSNPIACMIIRMELQTF